jgi:hypothetical protein
MVKLEVGEYYQWDKQGIKYYYKVLEFQPDLIGDTIYDQVIIKLLTSDGTLGWGNNTRKRNEAVMSHNSLEVPASEGRMLELLYGT